MRASAFFFSFLILGLFSCENLRNQADRISVECGLSKDIVKGSAYIKLLAPDGGEFETADIKAIQVVFANQQDKTSVSIPLTSRACLKVPSEAGFLQVINSVTADSLTQRIEPRSSNVGLERFKLIKKPELKVSLACPSEGLFADQSVKNPLFISLTGDTAGLDIRLDAFAHDGTFARTLMRKSLGESQLALTDNLNLASLHEGTYLLKVYGYHISEGVDAQPHLLANEEACQLHILRGDILVGGFTKTELPPVFPLQAELPWHVDASYEKMMVCIEPHKAAISKECRPQTICTDPRNFKEVKKISAGDAGIHDFYVYAENKAGAKSPLSCQTVITSPNAPALKVTWDHADLQEPGSVLRKPYPILRANLETSHDLLDQSVVEETLSCKVEFEIKGKSHFADKSVTCLEGRCSGQSMADFVPCDKHLSFSIVESLNQTMLLSSRLILTVRAHDKAGHQTEAKGSVWVNQSTWDREFLEYKINNSPVGIMDYEIGMNEEILASFTSSQAEALAYRTDGDWVSLKRERPTCNCTYNVTKTRDGLILASRTERLGDNSITSTLFHFHDRQLEKLTNDETPSQISQCSVIANSLNDIYCAGNFGNIFRLEDKHWRKLPPAMEEEQDASIADWRLMANGNLVGTRLGQVVIWNGSEWVKHAFDIPATVGNMRIVEDFQGRLWFITADSASDISLSRLDGSRLIPYAPEKPIRGDSQTIPLADQFQKPTGLASILIGFNKFDFSTMQWSVVDLPADKSKGIASSSRTNRNFISYATQGFFEDSPVPLYWPIQAMGYRCYSYCNKIERSQRYLYFTSFDRATGNSTLVRLQTLQSASFNSQMLDLQDVRRNGSWIDEGGLHLIFRDGTVLTPLADSFAFEKAPAEGGDVLQMTRLSQNSYCVARGSGLYRYYQNQQTTKLLIKGGLAESLNCLEDKQGNLWWYNAIAHQVLTYRDNAASIVDGIGNNMGETIGSAFSMYDSSWIGVLTSNRLVFFNPDITIAQELPLAHFGPDSAMFSTVAPLSETELMVRVQMKDNTYAIFILDPRTGAYVRDTELENIIGTYVPQTLAVVGAQAYMLTYNPEAYIVRRSQGHWKSIVKFKDVRPYINEGVPPPFFSVDTFNRVWVMTLEPTNLIRVDTSL